MDEPAEVALLPDEALVELTKQGRDEAFVALVARYGDAVYSIVRNMSASASDAEALTQQTFISAHDQIASTPLDATFKTWLFGIAIKTSLGQRREQGGAAPSPQPLPTTWNEADPPTLACRKWPDLTDPALRLGNLEEPLRDALDRMDNGVRAAFVLADLAELPATEIAALLMASPVEVLERVHRARLMLLGVIDRCLRSWRQSLDVAAHPA
jgi:RNA polymerase sigma-70 factor (ECF subfamily)